MITLSSTYKTWTVLKRYSDFEEFHKRISKKLFHLPPFLQKSIFRFSSTMIVERMDKFEQYLNYLIKKVNTSRFPELIEFLSIDKDTIDIFIKNNNMLYNILFIFLIEPNALSLKFKLQ